MDPTVHGIRHPQPYPWQAAAQSQRRTPAVSAVRVESEFAKNPSPGNTQPGHSQLFPRCSRFPAAAAAGGILRSPLPVQVKESGASNGDGSHKTGASQNECRDARKRCVPLSELLSAPSSAAALPPTT